MVLSGTRDLARPDEPQRAMDLSMKLQVLREVRDDHRAATFATGTPIPNSPREMWVMLDYLRPDLLKAAGVEHFDAWAANHLRPETRLEMKITGAGFAPRTRITRFVNVPEMTRMWRQMADQVTRDNLDVQLPTLPPGGRSTTAIPRSAEQAAYSAALESRADAVRSGAVKPDQDNILKISSDGRKAALDQRLVALPPDPAGGRLAAATRAIMRLHESTKDRVYTDEDGRPSPRTGGLQIVFCDQSTPKPGQWNVYTALRDDLTDAGMPRDRIRFIHEASSDAQRADLFAAARDGRIHVLIGSTHKMGTGANIQARAVGLHHLDVPWRPSDLEQREGRILRQGNQNTRYGPVQIHTYVTESTFDAFSWNLVTGKARFIAQVKNGGTARHVDADDADTLSFEQITALSAGDPRILERHQLGVDAARLGRLQRAHTDEQHRVAFELHGLQARHDDTAHILTRVDGAACSDHPDRRGRVHRHHQRPPLSLLAQTPAVPSPNSSASTPPAPGNPGRSIRSSAGSAAWTCAWSPTAVRTSSPSPSPTSPTVGSPPCPPRRR